MVYTISGLAYLKYRYEHSLFTNYVLRKYKQLIESYLEKASTYKGSCDISTSYFHGKV